MAKADQLLVPFRLEVARVVRAQLFDRGLQEVRLDFGELGGFGLANLT